ncbi:MAG: hypothetical protein ACK5EA_02375 [Planctomycetaceae bacterium]
MAARGPADLRTSEGTRAAAWRGVLVAALTVCGGCSPEGLPSGANTAPTPGPGFEFVPSDSLLELTSELAHVVNRQLRTETGTPAAPRLA